MSFATIDTLAGYARAAIDLRARMAEHFRTKDGRVFMHAFVDHQWPTDIGDGTARPRTLVDDLTHAVGAVWQHGEPFVCAPAMTAVVAAAAGALDLTGDLLTLDAAPCPGGVLFLPEPIYHRRLDGRLTGIAALTWTPIASGGSSAWLVCGWVDRNDPDDPNAASIRDYIAQDPTLQHRLGPYVLSTVNYLPIAQPVPAVEPPPTIDEPDRDWHSAPDGRCVLTDDGARTHVAIAVASAFWRISAQPIATVARPPLDRPARRRALRASLKHDTRIVMLRRTNPVEPRGEGEAKWR